MSSISLFISILGGLPGLRGLSGNPGKNEFDYFRYQPSLN